MRKLARIFKAVGDENRLRILKMLEKRTMCVCEIAYVLGLSQSTTSRHLKILEEAGLVLREKAGLWVEYSLPTEARDPSTSKLLELIGRSLSDEPAVLDDRAKAERINRELAAKNF